MTLYLVHHGPAVGPDVDPRRPLSAAGQGLVERLASHARARGVRPDIVWHSGKLRARQTAEILWRTCNALAEFSASRDIQPNDPPEWMRDRLQFESRNVLIAGHFPHLPRLLALLLPAPGEKRDGALAAGDEGGFPAHGLVALDTADEGASWRELWRLT